MLLFFLRHQTFRLAFIASGLTLIVALLPYYGGGVEPEYLFLLWAFWTSPIWGVALNFVLKDYRQYKIFAKLSANYGFNFLAQPKKGLPSIGYTEWNRKGEYLFGLQFGKSSFVLHYKEEFKTPLVADSYTREWDKLVTHVYQDVVVLTDPGQKIQDFLSSRGFQCKVIEGRQYWFFPTKYILPGRFLDRREVIELFHLVQN